MRIRSFILGGLALLASLSTALAQVNVVPQVGVITAFTTQKQTFTATASVAAAASATDVAVIYGSATKTIRVQSITVTGTTTTTAVVSLVDIIKRSAQNTGGTSTLVTKVPVDSANAAATALVDVYTANPTVATAVGVMAIQSMLFSLSSTVIAIVPAVFNFNAPNLLGQPVTLRGTAQGLTVNLNGTSANVTLQVTFVWTEE